MRGAGEGERERRKVVGKVVCCWWLWFSVVGKYCGCLFVVERSFIIVYFLVVTSIIVRLLLLVFMIGYQSFSFINSRFLFNFYCFQSVFFIYYFCYYESVACCDEATPPPFRPS